MNAVSVGVHPRALVLNAIPTVVGARCGISLAAASITVAFAAKPAPQCIDEAK
jgi:hypothetical protein